MMLGGRQGPDDAGPCQAMMVRGRGFYLTCNGQPWEGLNREQNDLSFQKVTLAPVGRTDGGGGVRTGSRGPSYLAAGVVQV